MKKVINANALALQIGVPAYLVRFWCQEGKWVEALQGRVVLPARCQSGQYFIRLRDWERWKEQTGVREPYFLEQLEYTQCWYCGDQLVVEGQEALLRMARLRDVATPRSVWARYGDHALCWGCAKILEKMYRLEYVHE